MEAESGIEPLSTALRDPAPLYIYQQVTGYAALADVPITGTKDLQPGGIDHHLPRACFVGTACPRTADRGDATEKLIHRMMLALLLLSFPPPHTYT